MRPMGRRDAETCDPMNPLAEGRAVKDELCQLVGEIRFHVQQLEAKHLRLKRDGM